MEVILKKTVDTLGEEGDIVTVKPGYGRNYLIPTNKAVLKNKENQTLLEQQRTTIEARKNKHRDEADALAEKIEGCTVVLEQKVGEDNKLYGSVSSADIAVALAKLGVEIDRKKIMLENPIRAIGETTVPVKIAFQRVADLKVEVIPEPAV